MKPVTPPEHPDNRSSWATLVPGEQIAVVKLAPDGAEAARYAATVVASRNPGNWVITCSEWTFRQVDLDGLSFVPADVLLEWFSPEHSFNAFATFSKTGEFRGWYANVAHPARLIVPSATAPEAVLVWHDLYLDLVGLPDGSWSLRDEDELHQAGLYQSNPTLLAAIETASAELQRRFVAAQLPFVSQEELRSLLHHAEIPSNRH